MVLTALTAFVLLLRTTDFVPLLRYGDSNSAANYQLAANYPVMAVGGFGGGDPAPTLEQFQRDVTEGRIHYFVAGAGRGPGDSSTSEGSKITAWVNDHYTAVQVDEVTLYDLTSSPHNRVN
ncbi:hypothetical protein GFY24_17340 [Nocardia sp. SYP-A9097]|uniref:hypothetical protein n=1 Tax=Nocardia sp. SYP-A9097 TaxID=2663237 RepID=UPI00129A26B9|nr:hypothetical protein [Nocardia sp. SYP-A9097]MRH89193.1 hypothetical protein [Nocardia sp. SYP-A9097]